MPSVSAPIMNNSPLSLRQRHAISIFRRTIRNWLRELDIMRNTNEPLKQQMISTLLRIYHCAKQCQNRGQFEHIATIMAQMTNSIQSIRATRRIGYGRRYL